MATIKDRRIERLIDGTPPFLIKLYNMVDDIETDSIISWGSISTTFVISNLRLFVCEILPRYFKTNRFDSFTSQLNNYGFVKKKEQNRLEFGHEHFQKGKQYLLKNIKSKKRQTNSNLVVDNMCSPQLCDQLKAAFVKTRDEQKEITHKFLRFNDNNQKTLSDVKNSIRVMSQRLLPLTSSRKRKFVGASDDDLSSWDEVSPIGVDVENCFKVLNEFVEELEAEKNSVSRSIPEFLHKLYDIVEKQDLDHLISWKLPDRDSFIIWDTNKLATHVLPLYFKHANFSSFNRQLNTYGFKKVCWERCEYANEWFVGGGRELLVNITRGNNLVGFGETCSALELKGFMTRLRKIQQRQENQITWLSKYEQQIKSSMHELKESVAKMDNIFNKKILKSGENLENVKTPKLDNQNVKDKEKAQESGDKHLIESSENNNMEQQSNFEEPRIDQEVVGKIIETKDNTVTKMNGSRSLWEYVKTWFK